MNQPLPRHHKHTEAAQDRAKIARLLASIGEHTDPELKRTGTWLAVDNTRLRGIPAIGRGVTGAIPGTRPEDTLRT